MGTFSDRIINFNKNLNFKEKLPKGIKVMNPFEDPTALKISSRFFRKFYKDNRKRFLILGINPGRFGAGITGVPFTDTKRLIAECGITFPGPLTHEPSSTFVYEVVNAMGGAKPFYKNFIIQSICPLGFTITNKRGKDVNYNYYDSPKLQKAAMPFILESLYQLVELGVHTETVFCMGTGKNFKFVQKLIADHPVFDKIVPVEHPRYVMQYKMKHKEEYVQKYVRLFNEAMEAAKAAKGRRH